MDLALRLALLALLVGCSANEPARPSTSDDPLESPILLPTSSERAPSGGVPITGVFSVDAVEGGCPHLVTDDGTRYEVRYPAGWTLERNPYRLIDPDGEVVARGGERISVRGSVADDMASTCQIGPIFIATEVVSIEG